jgi:hypothetical protein
MNPRIDWKTGLITLGNNMTSEEQPHHKSTLIHTWRLDVEFDMSLDEVSPVKEGIQEVINEADKPRINEKQGNSLNELQMFIEMDANVVNGSEVPDMFWAYIHAMETTGQHLQDQDNDEDDQDSYRLYITLQDTEIEDD